MNRVSAVRGFSLLEVVVAAGLFAGTVIVAIAMLAVLVRQSGEVNAALVARRLPDAVKLELDRLAAGGFDALAAQLPVLGTTSGLPLVAAADGTALQSVAYRAPASERLSPSEQFFLVECWRFPDEPLRFDSTEACLAVQVRLSWPYRLPGLPAPVAAAERNSLSFAVALNR